MKTTKTMMAMVAMTLALGACMTDSPEDEALGEEGQAVTGHAGYVLADTVPATMNLGSTSGRACFLSGVAGSVTTWAFPVGNSSASAGVRVNGSNYELYINPTTSSSKLSAWARCIDSTTLTAPVTWSTGNAPATVAPVATGRYCFLTEIRTSRLNGATSADHGGFQTAGDFITVNSDGTNWRIYGNLVGRASGTARCVTVASNLGEWFVTAGTGLTTTVPMVPSNGGANACFLTQLSGEIDDGSDWFQGLRVQHNTTTLKYEGIAKDGTSGRIRCVN